ncbi:hypothetical protein A3K55_02205 [Candidatus Shapirobacteria bacterium RBG_13_44_7]|uniref:CAAX prenyl protease 2/Lysostaphin resistance protein A-like domain-containing protein n=1 Tax=Candidatus Shapirobacteria bacterium RBG_13_44_7 TaxID=1802149 RepID=A0A1F7SL99_9BACT|nr:MAG: hypothetical protein A3K55_02205 [Candidatus Shapirobacteria bacterium RBG_13_44_7]
MKICDHPIIVVGFEVSLLVLSFFYLLTHLSPSNFSQWPLALAVGNLLGIITFCLTFFFVSRFQFARDNMFQYHRHYLFASPLTKTASCLVVPIAEEIFFRGLIFSFLGFFPSLFLFIFVHLLRLDNKIATAASVLLCGLSFHLSYYLTGSLLAPIIAHMVFTFLRIFIFPEYIKSHPQYFSDLTLALA